MKRFQLISLCLAWCLSAGGYAGEVAAPQAPGAPTRIAVAATAADDEAPVSRNIAQATHFILYTDQGEFLETVPSAGAAPASVALLAAKNVSVLVAQSYDDKVLELLNGHDIIPIEKASNVRDAVISLLQCEPNPPLEEAGTVSPGAATPAQP